MLLVTVGLVILDYKIFDCFLSKMPDFSLEGRRITLMQHNEMEKNKDLERAWSIMIY